MLRLLPTPGTGGGPSLRLLLLDFDLTVSSIHVFHEMQAAGMQCADPDVPAGGAAMQVFMLNRRFPTKEAVLDGAFGGAERGAALLEATRALRAAGCTCYIVSHGYTEVIRTALDRAGLASMVDGIVGRDSTLMRECRMDKRAVAESLRARFQSPPEETLLVDDDLGNLHAARMNGTCATMWVWDVAGMTTRHITRLRDAATERPAGEPFAARRCALAPALAAFRKRDYFLGGRQGVAGSPAEAAAACNLQGWQLRWDGCAAALAPDGGCWVLHCCAEDAAAFDSLLRRHKLPPIERPAPGTAGEDEAGAGDEGAGDEGAGDEGAGDEGAGDEGAAAKRRIQGGLPTATRQCHRDPTAAALSPSDAHL
eukprot:TRINITY_DN18528_c0_g1_i2.p1 TRINITY_DN18528_c0_g1~~TRINITY_DN18528_c0_g1_i2.p1  ORF type:complete len:368 (+),score=95.84 TRINITY_DN18528_c0_g1_i2:134-1237(+)